MKEGTYSSGWEMKYPFPGQWLLKIVPMTSPTQEQFAGFFEEMAAALRKAQPPEPAFPVPQRMPQTPAEEADYLAAARQGLSATYAWLFGPESRYAQESKGTWQDLGFKTAEDGARELLAAIREHRPLVIPGA